MPTSPNSRAFLVLVLVMISVYGFASANQIAFAAAPKTLTSPNAMSGGEFGITVGVNTVVAVGAPFETAGGFGKAGHVYTFNPTTGALLNTLQSPNAQSGGEFGFFVAVSNVLVVSASHESVSGKTSAGRVYTFNPTSGALINTLVSPNSQAHGAFGGSIDVSTNYIAVGAPGETVSGQAGAGRAYLYSSTTGSLIDTFVSPNSQAKGLFGTWVAVSNTYLVVGAVGETVSGQAAAGRAYVFDPTTGSLITTLVSPNVQAGAKFGWELGIKGGDVLVTAPFETVSGFTDGGHAYVYNPTNGALIYTLTSPNEKANGEFGFSATEDATSFVIGAPGETPAHVYVFGLTTGALTRTLSNSVGGRFGGSVAALGSVIVVGASKQKASGFASAGHAYLY